MRVPENRRCLGWTSSGTAKRKHVIKIRPDATGAATRHNHGGIIASIFDDAMAWAVRQAIGGWAVTGEMSVRYLRPVKEKYTPWWAGFRNRRDGADHGGLHDEKK